MRKQIIIDLYTNIEVAKEIIITKHTQSLNLLLPCICFLSQNFYIFIVDEDDFVMRTEK
jgi:hypothetical protein